MRRLKLKGKSGKQSERLSNPTCVFLLEFNKSVIKLEANRLVSVTGEKMKNEVTAYGIFKALRETDANALSTKAIAVAANIDPMSENLREIEEQLFDANHKYINISGTKNKFWVAIKV